jgi:hypothetical protein
MGSLDQPTGTSVSRYIKFVDVTGYTPDQIETVYNNQYGKNGWRIIQVIVIASKIYLVAEKEY